MKPIMLALVMLLYLTSCGGQLDIPRAPAVNNQPVPDCAPQNCSGLRIIDGNAEVYRYTAQHQDPAPSEN